MLYLFLKKIFLFVLTDFQISVDRKSSFIPCPLRRPELMYLLQVPVMFPFVYWPNGIMGPTTIVDIITLVSYTAVTVTATLVHVRIY